VTPGKFVKETVRTMSYTPTLATFIEDKVKVVPEIVRKLRDSESV
jgi:hypothetical protein